MSHTDYLLDKPYTLRYQYPNGNRESFPVPYDIFMNTDGLPDLTPYEKLVYIVMSFNVRSQIVKLHVNTIAEFVGCNTDTVRKCIKSLQEKGYVHIE